MSTSVVAGHKVQAPYRENYYVVAVGDFGVSIRGPFASLGEAEQRRDLARRDYRETGTKASVTITKRRGRT